MLLAAAPLPLAGAQAHAHGKDVILGPSFAYVPDVAGLAQAACTSRAIARSALRDVAERVRTSSHADAQLALFFASEPLGCDELFYLPLANDVRGIGYRHEDAREVFDDTPESRLEGIVFLNDLSYWEERPEELRSAWLHEIGHRWSARVRVRRDDLEQDALLGRELQHWSYYLDSGGSPLEGNRWLARGEDRFEAHTPMAPNPYSELDLYLMGALNAEQVAPIRLLRPTPNDAHDCLGRPLTPASPPQWCEPRELPAAAITLTIDDVLRAEGPRTPPARAHQTVDLAIIVLASGDGSFDAARCTWLDTSLRTLAADFSRATGDRLALRYLTEGGSCSALPSVADRERNGEGCAVREGSFPMELVAALLLLLRWRRRRLS